MIYLSKGGGGRCRFGPYVDPPLHGVCRTFHDLNDMGLMIIEQFFKLSEVQVTRFIPVASLHPGV